MPKKTNHIAKAKRIAKARLKRKLIDRQETGMGIIISIASAMAVMEKMGHKSSRFPDFPEARKEWLEQLSQINEGIREWMTKTLEEE